MANLAYLITVNWKDVLSIELVFEVPGVEYRCQKFPLSVLEECPVVPAPTADQRPQKGMSKIGISLLVVAMALLGLVRKWQMVIRDACLPAFF